MWWGLVGDRCRSGRLMALGYQSASLTEFSGNSVIVCKTANVLSADLNICL